MKAIPIHEIREALRFGDEKGYVLFEEIRKPELIAKVKEHTITQVMVKDIIALADKIKDQVEKALPFRKFIFRVGLDESLSK